MTNVLLTLSYDGTDFCGWQKQEHGDHGKPVRTVQGEIEKALAKLLKENISLTGSGRTDSGVHARGQAATFLSPIDSIPEEGYVRALNSSLPQDIRILKAEKVPENFSARFSATSRKYRYFIYTGNVPPADRNRFVWHIARKPNLQTLNEMCSVLGGEQNFATFTAAGDQSTSTFRYIEGARFYENDEDSIVFEIEANAFLWKMVRSLTGTFILGEQKGYDAAWFKETLESCDRSKALVTAPPTGLFLWEVKFNGKRRGKTQD